MFRRTAAQHVRSHRLMHERGDMLVGEFMCLQEARRVAQVLTMTSNKRIMGAAFTNRPVVAALAWAIAAVVCYHASSSLAHAVASAAVAVILLL